MESNIGALVLLNLLNLASLAFYLFSPTRLINSIKHEHSCKILYVNNKSADAQSALHICCSNATK